MEDEVEKYFEDGCGACSFFGTDRCHARRHKAILRELRAILDESGLTPQMRWAHPSYHHEGDMILLMRALEPHVALTFYDSKPVADPEKLLIASPDQGLSAREIHLENWQSVVNKRQEIQKIIEAFKRS